MTKVITQNSDEFQESSDVMGRYKTLKEANELLKNEQAEQEKKLTTISEQLLLYQKEQTQKTVTKGGNIAQKQKILEDLDSEKEKIIAANEENSSAKMATTCEHGQILMTINNLYLKVTRKELLVLTEVPKRKDDHYEPPHSLTHFDDTNNVQTVIEQHQLVKLQAFTNAYTELIQRYSYKKVEKKKPTKPKD